MEPPPAKRLRILQSVEVDEDNPEYVAAKQKQQQKFKGRLESIFAKFGNMHESMSDEIDMRDNRVVVDRGHLRRLERKVGRNEMMLLDTLGVKKSHEHMSEEEEEEGSECSDDELAPIQPNTPQKRRFEDIEETVLPPPNPNPIADPISQPVAPLPHLSDPAVNLLNLVQFPQTPAGQQAQANFYTTLTQTINQAVQQAVAPLFSSLLPNKTHLPLQFTNSIQAPITPVQADDRVAPATDPKWYFPPLSEEQSRFRVAQSSPMPVREQTLNVTETGTRRPVTNIFAQKNNQTKSVLTKEASVASVRSSAEDQDEFDIWAMRKSPRPNINSLRGGQGGHRRKHHFTPEDNIYISKQKVIHKLSWPKIRSSREKWKEWPLSAFWYHWSSFLSHEDLHLCEETTEAQILSGSASPQIEETSHLPTPSSLEHEDSCTRGEEHDAEHENHDSSSIAHFNEDERDLLSLAGTETDSEQHQAGEEDEDGIPPALEDVVLPSVEMEESTDEATAQKDQFEGSPTVERTPVTTTIKTEPSSSLPSSKQTRKFKPIGFVADSESESEDDIDVNFPETADDADQTPTRQSSVSVDPVSEDDSEITSFSLAKRELSTPPSTKFLFSTPALQTSSSFTQHCSIHSSGSKSTTRLDRRAFLKQVKQSWTKNSGSGSKVLAKRKSFPSMPIMQRARIDGGAESEDELA